MITLKVYMTFENIILKLYQLNRSTLNEKFWVFVSNGCSSGSKANIHLEMAK